MRKKMYFLLAISFLLAMGMTACSGDDDASKSAKDTVIKPVDNVDDAVKAFFENEMDVNKSSNGFFSADVDNTCLVVNSDEEFKEMYRGENDLPAIDFGKYTLVIGKKILNTGYFPVFTQEIVAQGNQYMLNISIPDGVDYYTVVAPLYCWGIYPKLQTKKVFININAK